MRSLSPPLESRLFCDYLNLENGGGDAVSFKAVIKGDAVSALFTGTVMLGA